ncbi:putative 1-phosphatidylinositol-3-phosphate 5-kinase FAB1C [Drosera capensis]
MAVPRGVYDSCSECEVKFREFCERYNCGSCGRSLCRSCVRSGGSYAVIVAGDEFGNGGEEVKMIKYCSLCCKDSQKLNSEKIYPSGSPTESHEPLDGGSMITNPNDDCISVIAFKEQGNELSHNEAWSGNLTLVPSHLPPIMVHRPLVRNDEEEAEDSAGHLFTPLSMCYNDSSDLDISGASAFHESYGFRSVGSSPSASPFRINVNQPGDGYRLHPHKDRRSLSYDDSLFKQEKLAISVMPERRDRDRESYGACFDGVAAFQSEGKKFQEPLDFENDGHIWFPPPPEYEDDEVESNYFEYDDLDDSDGVFSNTSSPIREKQNTELKEPLRAVIHGHFRALVSQLLQGEGVMVGNENRSENWLEIISTLAWQAANFVKPDTSNGGSMDPVDYVKVKCVASGRQSESILVKGIVCTKNIKHKRMTSQCRNPKLLLLGGSLEYQRSSNQFSSFNVLLEEEMNHIKVLVSKIEAHCPNVLLVEKSVSPYAQEYLLAKEISLVLNVKRPLLERIAQCTGALITPSVENLPKARIGHCEFFRVEKVYEELEPAYQFHKKPLKSLMFFDGCPTRLGCTVLLKGSCREELKRVKCVVQYAVFAAYHLSLQTSFLADEGATLPKMIPRPRQDVPEKKYTENVVGSAACSSPVAPLSEVNMPGQDEGCLGESGDVDSPTKHHDASTSVLMCMDDRHDNLSPNSCLDCSEPDLAVESSSLEQLDDRDRLGDNDINGHCHAEVPEAATSEQMHPQNSTFHNNEAFDEYLSVADSQQSLLVSYSSRCVVKGTLCERARLLRITFYGSFDKPLGRYLHDRLFDQEFVCRSCKEPVEAHLLCYTHPQGSLTVNVRRLSSQKLPGEKAGKIWMWHRCLRCAFLDGIPPATRRVVLSDAAWGLSFGKLGNMVAFFRYSPIRILSVRLPPLMLEFKDNSKLEWIKKEAIQLASKMEALYEEIDLVLRRVEQKVDHFDHGSAISSDLHEQILELKDLLSKDRNDHWSMLHEAAEGTSHSSQRSLDILELNCLRLSLVIGSHVWNHRLYSLDSCINSSCSGLEPSFATSSLAKLKDLKSCSNFKDVKPYNERLGFELDSPKLQDASFGYPPLPPKIRISELRDPAEFDLSSGKLFPQVEVHVDAEIEDDWKASDKEPSPATSFSDRIDSLWTGTNQHPLRVPVDNLPLRKLLAPARVYSFDSALTRHDRHHGGLPPTPMHLSTIRSFHASGDYRSMVRDPVSSTQRAYYQISLHEALTLSSLHNMQPSYISSAAHLADGARLMLPHPSRNNLVIAVYDDEPTSIISYALSSKEHEDWVSDKLNEHEGNHIFEEDFPSPILSSFQSFGTLDLDYVNYGTYVSEAGPSRNGLFHGSKNSPHLRMSFGDDSSSAGGKVKKWSAQGGKSNVYFAKSMDDRFIIKQVTKTELDSFLEFGPKYFQYLVDSLGSKSPTCLAKILGIYQVTVKHLSGGKETKMDLMVMENLFFKRKLSKVYDLKGSSRSRYISDPMGKTKVLLDMNLLEALRTNPIFLGSKSKRNLERAVWNDTAFLASIDVMDYSLLVGVDEERKELVLGIIDFMRQYTWDKHLETWVKASGILGGPKNASPTIISPKQYKKRFRKAMTTYFITVPDQWPS